MPPSPQPRATHTTCFGKTHSTGQASRTLRLTHKTLASPDSQATPDEDPLAAEALDWFVRLQAEAGQPATIRAFRAWVEGDPAREQAFAKVAALWGAPEFLQAARNVARASPAAGGETRQRRGAIIRNATAGLIVLALALGATNASRIALWLRADYTTATGERRTVVLPDGSTILLNTGSAVAVDFDTGGRRVSLLKGEAFFDVRRDPARAFQVSGQFGRVAVAGTAFAVRADTEADTVVLSRGAVEVSRLSDPSQAAILSPGEAVSVTAAALLPVRPIDTSRSLEWTEGRLSFSERRFDDVLDELRRYFSGYVIVRNGRLGRIAVSGSYRLDDAGLAIRSLAEAAGASVTRLPGGIIILN